MDVSLTHIKNPVVGLREQKTAEEFIESEKDSETTARKLIKKKRKCTIYDLVEELEWTEGKAQKVIKRLEEAGIIKQAAPKPENGRLKKFYSLRTYREIERAYPVKN